MKLPQSEEQVFARLRHCSCEVCAQLSPAIVTDGASDPAFLTKRSPRLLFILKEANADGLTEWDMREFVRKGARSDTWNNLTRWIACAHGANISQRPSAQERSFWLQKAAFANIKKRPGSSIAVMKTIENYAYAHKNLLLEQFALYKPEITFACGTHPILRSICGNPPLVSARCKDGFNYFRDPKLGNVIDFYHPNSRQTVRDLLGFFGRNFSYHARELKLDL